MKFKIFCLLGLMVISPFWGWAGVFKADSADYAKNADAINEVIEKEYTINSDGSFDYHLYIRTRILTYRGKKRNGDFDISYNSAWQKVDVNPQRTGTVKADGTRVAVRQEEINDIQDPSTAKASIFSTARKKVISFPAVEPGAVVEADYTVHSKRPGLNAFWKREYFALSSPTRIKRVTVHVPAEVPLNWRCNSRIIEVKHTQKGGVVTWEWQGRDLPKAVDEPMSPPSVHKDPVLFISTLSSFNDVARYYNALIPWQKDTNIKFNIADTGTGDAMSVCTAEPDDRFVDGLYVKFMSLFRPFRIDFFKTDLKPLPPEKTVDQGYGTSLQLAWLFRAILAQQGIDASLHAVSDACMVSMLPLGYMPDLFGTFCVKAGNRWYSFEKRELSPGVTGLDSMLAVNLATGNTEVVHDAMGGMDVTVLSMAGMYDGTTSGMLYSMSSGVDAAVTRRGFRYLTAPELDIARSMILHTVNPLARGKVRLFDLDNLLEPVGIKVNFTIPEPAPSLDDLTFYPVPASSMVDSLVKLSSKRKNPVWFPRNEREYTEFFLKIPPGARVKSLPRDYQGKAGPFSWNVQVRRLGRTIYYSRDLRQKRGIMHPGPELDSMLEAAGRLAGPVQGVVVY